ncbi:hypothetical protein [Erwinia sp. JUb26]|uniref:hypothetical protein n=1 Tax=Erwinia sp. JUb26 TaxID=2485126 RepID=UPI0011CE1624|nr:hypothetical protein [Erwinia sp. JUb26]
MCSPVDIGGGKTTAAKILMRKVSIMAATLRCCAAAVADLRRKIRLKGEVNAWISYPAFYAIGYGPFIVEIDLSR